MARTKQRLWECPNGKHAAVRAPSRPRRDDIRRYCLKCSEETGRLAARVCPSLERERDEAAERAKAKREARAKRQREREREKFVVNAVDAAGRTVRIDVREEVKKALNMKSLRRYGGSVIPMPEIRLQWRQNPRRAHTNGYDDIYFAVRHGMSAEWLMVAVVHECVHLLANNRRRYRSDGKMYWEHHGEEYRRILVDAYAERFPGVVCGSVKRQTAYQIDERVMKQLREQNKPTALEERDILIERMGELVAREAVR